MRSGHAGNDDAGRAEERDPGVIPGSFASRADDERVGGLGAIVGSFRKSRARRQNEGRVGIIGRAHTVGGEVKGMGVPWTSTETRVMEARVTST